MIAIVFACRPTGKRLNALFTQLDAHSIETTDCSLSVLTKPSLGLVNSSIHLYLSRAGAGDLDGLVSEDLVLEIYDILLLKTAVPGSIRSLTTDPHLISLWIIELADAWDYATIPKHAKIIISFRISTIFIAALKDVAFFVVNRARELFKDSALGVAITTLSFSVDLMNVVGFIAFANVGRPWFLSIAANADYRPTPGCQESFFTTTPLNHGTLELALCQWLRLWAKPAKI
ncbi:hypothetical protein BT96DRAFT_988605 [Gymnopus androsaceus JB14]|uniref:Uncharacterized protein n=1 Tax=Gymnopus androsaceus JB14 TaxID=1447944 RepID=A0A6A4I5Z4_9AGAR|nr:hypothetical protein BT96DRAFT_988605 [Gymnopus androsaceus JB14]